MLRRLAGLALILALLLVFSSEAVAAKRPRAWRRLITEYPELVEERGNDVDGIVVKQ